MHDRSRWSVLIPAAGNGERIGRGPKIHLAIAGRSFLDCVLAAADGISDDILVAVPRAMAEPATAAACTFVVGGATRQETVRILMEQSRHDYLLIHDVARPLCTPDLMRRVADAAAETGAAAAVGPVDVPVALLAEGYIAGARSAASVGIFQTPLAFHRDVLAAAYRHADADQRQAQSTLELVLATGTAVRAVAAERSNFKITTPQDLLMAEALEAAASRPR